MEIREDPDPTAPCVRATVADGVVTLNPWTPMLITGGPTQCVLEQLADDGVALADLGRAGEDGEELVVSFVTPRPTEAAREALIRWAERVGYARIWLDDRVVDLRWKVGALGTARVDCPTCGASWSDGRLGFWEGVRAAGWFPGACIACGGSLPEWSVDEPGAEDDDDDETPHLVHLGPRRTGTGGR